MDDIKIGGFEFDLINEYFTELERQGPGSAEENRQSFEFYRQFISSNENCRFGLRHGRPNYGDVFRYPYRLDRNFERDTETIIAVNERIEPIAEQL